MTNKMKVAEFRNLTDAALNHANKNFHSCVNSQELDRWLVVACDYSERLKKAVSSRLKEEDVKWHDLAIDDLENKIISAESDIKNKSREAYVKKLSDIAKLKYEDKKAPI